MYVLSISMMSTTLGGRWGKSDLFFYQVLAESATYHSYTTSIPLAKYNCFFLNIYLMLAPVQA